MYALYRVAEKGLKFYYYLECFIHKVGIKEGKPLSLFSMPETCCQRFLHIIRYRYTEIAHNENSCT